MHSLYYSINRLLCGILYVPLYPISSGQPEITSLINDRGNAEQCRSLQFCEDTEEISRRSASPYDHGYTHYTVMYSTCIDTCVYSQELRREKALSAESTRQLEVKVSIYPSKNRMVVLTQLLSSQLVS